MQSIPNYFYYTKRLVGIGLPMLLTSLSPLFMAIADNAMVGYLGEEVRAASAFVNVITGTAFLMLIGISSVLMPLVAGSVITKNYDKATRALKYSLLVSVFCGVVCVLILLCMGQFLDRMGQDEKVIALARQGYFQIITASTLLNTVSQPLKRYLDGLGFRFTNTTLSFFSAVINISLNYLLIEGRYGFPRLGLSGAGWATFFSRFIIMLIYLMIAWRFTKQGYITSVWASAWDQPYFVKMLKLGLPAGFELAMKMLYFNIINVMIGWMGVREQSSASILFSFIRLGLLLPVAIGTAGSILLAEEWRKDRKGSIGKVRRTAYGLTITLMLTIGLALYKASPWMLSTVFDPKEDVAILVKSLIGMTILFQVIDGLTFVGTGLLRGMRDTFVPFLITTFISLLFGIPLSFYLGFFLEKGLHGIFQGVIANLFITTVLLYARFSYKLKQLNV